MESLFASLAATPESPTARSLAPILNRTARLTGEFLERNTNPAWSRSLPVTHFVF